MAKAAKQSQPGRSILMDPTPMDENPEYSASGKLEGKTAIITGGDSGIGRAIAILFAKEGAKVAIIYLSEESDAIETKSKVEEIGAECLLFAGDVADQQFLEGVVNEVIGEFGHIDILINNAAEQHVETEFEKVSAEQIEDTFATNIIGHMLLTKLCLTHMKEGSAIINTASVTAYHGNPQLIDYSATKGAIVSFTRSLALSVVEKGIRVNAVAPGPIWTPLIEATFPKEKLKEFGKNTPMKRAGQPYEVAPCYVFLASDDSSYMTGQVLHPNGGVIVNG